MTKILALYLPQFHETPENNKWWGKGFTEWTNTRKAKPFFKGHYQPRIPFKNNYYDLSDVNVMLQHAETAKKHGIYGFCYYHYWFGGKQMLQKPLLQMLNNPAIDIPFCLSWANDSWNRAWDGEEKQILMRQEYGSKQDWLLHLEYLLPYFKDDRYLKEENKPVFFIYRAVGYDHMNEMLNFWSEELKKHGFNGIYVVETLNSFQTEPSCEISEAVFYFEPMYSLRKSISLINKFKGRLKLHFNKPMLTTDSYSRIWKNIIRFAAQKPAHDKQVFPGAFVDWDNTARKGRNGLVVQGASPQKFGHYLSDLLDIAQNNNNKYVLINAWNEWAEGCYLEADEKFGYAYLEAVKKAVDKSN
jgi:lipopolysaccharide biosynthesis protein